MKSKDKDIVKAYIRLRDRLCKSPEYFRCNEGLKGLKTCEIQCKECDEWYEEKK